MEEKEKSVVATFTKRMFTDISKDPSFLDGNSGYGFHLLPNPDKILREKGLRYDVWFDMLNDTHLSGAIDARKASIKGMQWEINSENTENEIALEIVKKSVNNVNVSNVINSVLDALLWGFQPMELLWKIINLDGNVYSIPYKLNWLPPNKFGFNYHGELCLSNNGLLSSRELNLEIADKRKIICVIYEGSANNPYGSSLLSRCYWPVNWKRGVKKFWVDYLERFGFPNIKITYDVNKAPEEVTDVVNVIASSIQDSVYAISEDYKMEIIDSTSNGSSAIFESFLKFCDDEISKAILGHTGSMRSESGKLGNENVAIDSKLDKKLADKKLVEDTINSVIDLIYEQNFPNEVNRARFILYDEKNIGIDRVQLDKGLYDMNIRFSEKYIVDTYGVPLGEFWSLDKKPTAAEEIASSPTVKGTVGGIQVVAGLVEKYEQKALSRESCIALAKIAFGYIQEEAEALFPLPKLPTLFASNEQGEGELITEDELQKISANLTAQVLEEIGKSASFEDALERVNALYPKLDSSEFIATLEKLYFVNLVKGAIEGNES